MQWIEFNKKRIRIDHITCYWRTDGTMPGQRVIKLLLSNGKLYVESFSTEDGQLHDGRQGISPKAIAEMRWQQLMYMIEEEGTPTPKKV